jgi:hypothetical protein
MATTWHAMDWFFALPTQVGSIAADGPLNLLTFKNTGGTYADPGGRNGGIEWSGYQRGNRLLVIVSNLGNGAQAATGAGVGANGNWGSVLASLGGNLPSQSPVVPPGNHLVLQYLTNPTSVGFAGFAQGSRLGTGQGWHNRGATLQVTTAGGSGDGGAAVLAITGTSGVGWVANPQTANPGGIGTTANDSMVYTCKLYTGWSGNGSASFAPVVGGGSTVPVGTAQQGPTLWANVGGSANSWAFGSNFSGGGTYSATNFPPTANTWYQVAMIVDPSTNMVNVYVQNLTTASGWVLLEFSGGLTTLPAGLVPGTQSPSLYNGFEISGPPGAQFDALGAELYAYPASPASTYNPGTYVFTPPSSGPPSGPGDSPTDGPLPSWAVWVLGAGLLGIGTLAIRRRGSVVTANHRN